MLWNSFQLAKVIGHHLGFVRLQTLRCVSEISANAFLEVPQLFCCDGCTNSIQHREQVDNLRKQCHDVRLIAAQFVKPFVKSNKNDFVDAEAIAEAVERKNMRFVPIKTDDQLDLQAIHRVRDRLISRPTAIINQLRAFLLERGLVFAKTPARLRAALPDVLENADLDLTTQMRNLIDLLWKEWKIIEGQIEGLSLELERIYVR